MESTPALKRSTTFTAVAATVALALLAAPVGAGAARIITGGTTPPGTSGTGTHSGGQSPGTSPGPSKRPTPTKPTAPPQPAVAITGRAVCAGELLLHQATRSLYARLAAAAGTGAEERPSGGFPALVGRAHREQLAERTPALLQAGPRGDGARQRTLGRDRGGVGPGPPVEHVRADQGGDPRAAPARAEAPAGARTGAGEHHRDHRGRHGVRGPGAVDLVLERLRRGLRGGDRSAGARGGRHDAVRQELGRLDQLLEPVQQTAGGRSARTGPARVRVAVRVRVEPRGRGGTGRAGGGRRGGLPGDRRGGPVRRAVRGGADVHHDAARARRARVPGGAGVVPVRLLPPVVPLLGLPGPGRGAVQRAADVLARHRHVGGERVREHVRTEPRVRPPDPAARPNLRGGELHGSRGVPLAGRRVRGGGRVVLGLAGNHRGGVDGAGGPAEHDPHRAPAGADLTAAARRRALRPGALAAGAPRERVPGPADDGDLRSADGGEPQAGPDRSRPPRNGGNGRGYVGVRAGNSRRSP